MLRPFSKHIKLYACVVYSFEVELSVLVNGSKDKEGTKDARHQPTLQMRQRRVRTCVHLIRAVVQDPL